MSHGEETGSGKALSGHKRLEGLIEIVKGLGANSVLERNVLAKRFDRVSLLNLLLSWWASREGT